MLSLGRVVAAHPESHAVDIVLMDDNRRFGGVQVLSPMAGGNVGISDIPAPTVSDPRNPYDSDYTGERDVYAVVAFVSRDIPVVMGFLYPQISQCLFEAQNFRVNRHASDVYHTVDGEGNVELFHPSGTYMRIGETPDHVDLTGADYDKKWKIAHNVDRLPNVRVMVKNKNGVQTTLTIAPNGNVTLDTVGNIAVTAEGTMSYASVGNATFHSDGKIDINAGGDINIDAGGTVNVTGSTINLN